MTRTIAERYIRCYGLGSLAERQGSQSQTYRAGRDRESFRVNNHGTKGTSDNDTKQYMLIGVQTVYDEIIAVNRIVNKHPANLYLMDRPDLISTFTKIELWRQTQFRQIVYIDADMLAIRAPNELLNYDADFAAVPDIGWPDCFNSGLLVLRPNLGDYYSLLALAQRGISFDGADQGLLNMHFQDWERLSFTYNCTPSGNYQYVPAYKHFQSSISLVHFIGRDKPWTMGRDHKHTSGVYGELLGRWWSTYDKHYRVHVGILPKTDILLAEIDRQTSYYSKQTQDAPRTVQYYVKGEKTTSYLGYSQAEPQPNQPPPPTIHVQPPPEASVTTTEGAMGDQPEPVEQMDKEEFEPTPTAEQRRFSAPHMEWDASRYVQCSMLIQSLISVQCSTSDRFETRSLQFPITNLRI
jgi:glycogenin